MDSDECTVIRSACLFSAVFFFFLLASSGLDEMSPDLMTEGAQTSHGGHSKHSAVKTAVQFL